MRIPLIPICILVLAGLSAAIAQDRPRPARTTLALPSEEREATLAIAAKRRELGLPLSSTPLQPRDCAFETTCPNGSKASCSASGKFTQCGSLHNQEGMLMGVGCFAYRTANPNEGTVSVNQSSCGG